MEALLFDTLLTIGVALCPLGIVVLLIWFVLSVAMPINQKLKHLKRLNSTPCDRCYYFNPDLELHCAVHPSLALTKRAMHCHDFEPTPSSSVVRSSPPLVLERGIKRL